jgi:competence protein ComEA
MKAIWTLFLSLLLLTTQAFALVDLNTATQAELETLSGIGPSKAKAIIDYRTTVGPFGSVDDLVNVKGIGDKTLLKIKDDLTVTGDSSKKTSKPMVDKAIKSAPLAEPATMDDAKSNKTKADAEAKKAAKEAEKEAKKTAKDSEKAAKDAKKIKKNEDDLLKKK